MAGGVLAVENADAIPWLVGAGVALTLWFVLFAKGQNGTASRVRSPHGSAGALLAFRHIGARTTPRSHFGIPDSWFISIA